MIGEGKKRNTHAPLLPFDIAFREWVTEEETRPEADGYCFLHSGFEFIFPAGRNLRRAACANSCLVCFMVRKSVYAIQHAGGSRRAGRGRKYNNLLTEAEKAGGSLGSRATDTNFTK